MAQELKLRRNAVNTSLINTSGFHILDPGWIPKVAEYTEGRVPPPVNEALTIESCYGTQDALAAGEIVLNKLGRDAVRYIQDRTEQHPVWLHDKLDNETGERRALVRKMKLERLTEQHGSGEMIAAKPIYRLGIEREGLWERPTARDMPQVTPAAGLLAVYDYTAAGWAVGAHNIVGDAPARIETLQINPNVAGDQIARLWIGIRSTNKHGTLANFITAWELENGTNNAAESGVTDQADATASGGNKVQVVEIDLNWDDEWNKVLEIQLSDVSANESDNFGRFLQLLRTKVTAGEWDVQLRFGYAAMPDADFIRGRIQSISLTSWDFLEMDETVIPLRDFKALPMSNLGDYLEKNYEIQIWARRTSGAGNLELDCLCPVPLDEGWLASKDFVADGAAENQSDRWYFGESPHGHTQAMCRDFSATAWGYFATLSSKNFRLPPGDGRMIVVYARATSSDITDQILINNQDDGWYYESWHTLRGAE